MTDQTLAHDELDLLIQQLSEGTISSESATRLEAAMQTDPSLRRQVLEAMHLEACLGWEFNRPAEVKQLESPEEELVELETSLSGWRAFAYDNRVLSLTVAGLATAIMVLSLALATVPELRRQILPGSDPLFVARVHDTRNAVWQLDKDEPTPEQLRTGQTLRLQSGHAEIELFSGTTSVLEGPAEITFHGENSVTLVRGLATFSVPEEAQGFRVSTRAVEVVDLGTEFGVYAEQDGAAEVHVFSGLVEATPAADVSGAKQVSLATGESARFGFGSTSRDPSRYGRGRFTTSLRDTSVVSRLMSAEQTFRLLDLDRDDQGDEVLVAAGLVAVGEWNGERPAENEGRVWIDFQLTDAHANNIQHGLRVLATVESTQFNGIELAVSAFGVACATEHEMSPADYHVAGNLLAEDVFDQLGGTAGTATIDVTEFAQQVVAQGERRLAIRLQVAAPRLPTDDQRKDNVLIRVGGQQRPSLIIRTPRAEFRSPPEDAEVKNVNPRRKIDSN